MDLVISVIRMLCYGTVVDFLVSSDVRIPLQVTDCAAPVKSCKDIS